MGRSRKGQEQRGNLLTKLGDLELSVPRSSTFSAKDILRRFARRVYLVYGQVPFKRWWAHKARNDLNYVRRADQKEVKKDLHGISQAPNLPLAQKAAQRSEKRRQKVYPKAVHCLKTDLDDLLTFLKVKTSLPPSALRTANAVKRRFRIVRRRTRPMGVFSNHTSVERIIFSVFTYENLKDNTFTLFPMLIQNN